MELRQLMTVNEDEMTYTITLGKLRAWLQEMRWDAKIALFKEYAENDDSATIDEMDVLEQLHWNGLDPKEIGYWRTVHQTRWETLKRNENQTKLETQTEERMRPPTEQASSSPHRPNRRQLALPWSTAKTGQQPSA